MLLDQNHVTAVYASITDSCNPGRPDAVCQSVMPDSQECLLAMQFVRFHILQIHSEFNHFREKND